MTPETALRLARLPRVLGIKEAAGDVRAFMDHRRLLDADPEADMALLAGDDELYVACLAFGGTGVVSVLGNAVPEAVAAIQRAWDAGDLEAARREQLHWLPLIRAMFVEPNPVPVKALLAVMGLMHPDVRLPLCEMQPANEARVLELAESYGLV